MPATKWNQDINAGQDWMAQLNLLTADGSANRDITGQTLSSEVRRHFKSVSPKTTLTIMINDAAQGLITLATYGVGMLIGFWIAGQISDIYILNDGLHNWQIIWTIPAIFALLVLIIFMVIFKNEKIELKN